METIRLAQKDFIYKYTTIGEHTLKNLLLSQLWFGPANLMNDQLEGLVSVKNRNFRPSLKAIDNFIKKWTVDEFYWDVQNQIRQQGFLNFFMNFWFRNELNRFGISCFSAKPLDPLMWAHYGNKHSGVCLIYSKEILFKDLLSSHINCRCVTIQYGTRPTITLHEKNGEIGYTSDISIVAAKNSNWKYEKEVRFVLEDSHGEPFLSRTVDISHSALKGVIYGYQTTEEDKDAISLLIRNDPQYNETLEQAVEIDFGTGEMYLVND